MVLILKICSAQLILILNSGLYSSYYWEIPDENFKCIELNKVTYGQKCSTFLATRCLLVCRYQVEFPAAVSILRNQSYYDDVLVSSNTLEPVNDIKKQLIQILELGGFEAHIWSSNCLHVLQNIPLDKWHFDLQKQNYCLKTLGVSYNVKTDTINITSSSSTDSIPKTIREILSHISKFYDPRLVVTSWRLVGPVIVSAKLII